MHQAKMARTIIPKGTKLPLVSITRHACHAFSDQWAHFRAQTITKPSPSLSPAHHQAQLVTGPSPSRAHPSPGPAQHRAQPTTEPSPSLSPPHHAAQPITPCPICSISSWFILSLRLRSTCGGLHSLSSFALLGLLGLTIVSMNDVIMFSALSGGCGRLWALSCRLGLSGLDTNSVDRIGAPKTFVCWTESSDYKKNNANIM